MPAAAWRCAAAQCVPHSCLTPPQPRHPAQGKEPMPEMLRLHAWLEAHLPPTDGEAGATRISHGDYR